MALTRDKKASILDDFKDIFGRVSSAVFVKFKGLTVSEATELRRALKKEGISYKVVKKTLLKKTLSESSVEGTAPVLDGEIAFAYPTDSADSTDTTAAARGIYEFEKKGCIVIVWQPLQCYIKDDVRIKKYSCHLYLSDK